jgi:hypothetical protein
VRVGVIGGLSQTSLFDASGWSAGLGYRVGASVSLPLPAGFTFEPEVAWARRTTTASGTLDSGTVESRIVLQYLEVPMLARRALLPHARVAPLIVGGVYYAANLTAHAHATIPGHTFDEDISSEITRNDAGWVAGGGVEFRQGRRRWTVEVRYLAGFVDINASSEAKSWRTRSLTTTVGMTW